MGDFTKIFKDKGINLTSARQAIFGVLEKSDDHISIEDIYAKAKKIEPNLGIATVYRTMNLLTDLNLVVKHEFDCREPVYEIIDEQSEHHHHLVDVETGKIVEFMDIELDNILQKVAQKYGYKMIGHKIEVYAEKE